MKVVTVIELVRKDRKLLREIVYDVFQNEMCGKEHTLFARHLYAELNDETKGKT